MCVTADAAIGRRSEEIGAMGLRCSVKRAGELRPTVFFALVEVPRVCDQLVPRPLGRALRAHQRPVDVLFARLFSYGSFKELGDASVSRNSGAAGSEKTNPKDGGQNRKGKSQAS